MKHEISDKPPARYQRSTATIAGSNVEQVPATDDGANKMKMPLWLQVIASISIPVILALLALVALINPQFAELRGLAIENRDDIAALDLKLSGEIAALDTKLTGQIAALDTKLTGQIAALDTELTGQIAALDGRLTGEVSRLDNRITVEVARLDNKFDALANLMIVAHSNGGATEAELVAIWESLRNPE